MKIVVLAGDGVGPEVTNSAVTVMKAVAEYFDIELSIAEETIGGVAIAEENDPLPDKTIEACRGADAVLLGAVGAPEFDNLPTEIRPEKGLLRLRQHLGGFANLRPSKANPELINASPLRAEVFEGTDLLIVRELLGGLYFGEPRGFDSGNDSAFNTLQYSRNEISRVARVAFEAAARRRGKLVSVDKANVLETSRLWRQVVNEIAAEYPAVEVEHMYVDACAMHLVTNPKQFDVIITDNLFGDILSDEAAVLTGSLGMLPSATIGGAVDLYEPIHGSAPDIAGMNIANPIGAVSSVALMFRFTANHEGAASAIENGISAVLAEGFRTKDIAFEGKWITTSEMTEHLLEKTLESAGVAHAFHAV